MRKSIRHFRKQEVQKSTILYHLSEKGYVDKKQSGLHHFYTVLVTKEEYEQALLRQQIEGVLGNTSF